jgi:hypothetical protein
MLNPSGLRLVRRELSAADDNKIRQVVALLDQRSTPDAANAILDQLRPRLAILRPPRRLRFARLLFMPLDGAIVPAQGWRPGDPAVPRSALAPLALTVRAALGDEIVEIERAIADRTTTDDDTVAEVGNCLWPRAAAILAAVPEPLGWDTTGLPAAFYPAAARAVAAVLRRTQALHDLVRETAIGTVVPDQTALQDLLASLPAESPEGFGIVIALLLERLPCAAMQIQRVVSSSRGSAESALLRQALDEGLDRALTRLETGTGFDSSVRNAPLRHVGQEVQRIAALLRDIENEPDTARHRHRLKAIRTQLDLACRARFGLGLDEGLVTPLTAAEPVTDVVQTGMETNARELRMLEAAARKVGNPALYDSLLEKAAAIVGASANAGVLTPVRQARLIEILAGPEAAEAVYRQSG